MWIINVGRCIAAAVLMFACIASLVLIGEALIYKPAIIMYFGYLLSVICRSK
jgi:hypothetical protein